MKRYFKTLLKDFEISNLNISIMIMKLVVMTMTCKSVKYQQQITASAMNHLRIMADAVVALCFKLQSKTSVEHCSRTNNKY